MDEASLVYAPKYIKVRESLRRRIYEGELKIGSKIPPERKLVEEYSVSRITILNAIKELVEEGYLERHAPKGTFVADFKKKSRTMGLLIPKIVCERYAGLNDINDIKYIYDYCRRKGYTLQIFTEEDVLGKDMFGELPSQVDGLVILGMAMKDTIIRASSVLPIVLYDYRLDSEKLVSVMPDNVEASRKIVSMLIRKGRSRIAHIYGPLIEPAFQERMEGYKKALKEFNIEFEDILVAEGGAQKVQGENAARKIFEKNKDNPPDALFAANDMMAFGAMKYIIENGIKIPADVAVAGFDDVSAAAHVIPSLTTVRVNRNLLIERCVDLLDQQINGNALEFPLNECIKTEIVIREST